MDKVNRPRRFYKTAEAVPLGAQWTVHLDTRPLRTPAKAPLAVPSAALAEAIAAEWNRQSATLELTAMTLTRLANVAIDRTPHTRTDLIEEAVRYAGTDVTCYLADGPDPLRARQDAAWRPVRDWAGETLSILLIPVEGVLASPQPEASLNAVRKHLEAMDDFGLTGLVWGCSLLGSALLALAVEQRFLSGHGALDASLVDADWQAEIWGRDAEAEQVRANRVEDAKALQIWFDALT